MDKQEFIDKVVRDFNGKWPSRDECDNIGICYAHAGLRGVFAIHVNNCNYITTEQFQQRAKELGYINGYQWGVEYQTNGVKPDLPDDVVVNVTAARKDPARLGDGKVDDWIWENSGCFKITDERYKPVEQKTEQASADWYDYDLQRMLKNPHVGCMCEVKHCDEWVAAEVIKSKHPLSGAFAVYCEKKLANGPNLFWSGDARPLDWDRKAEQERERVVDAALSVFLPAYVSSSKDGLMALYDAGFLKLPDQKEGK